MRARTLIAFHALLLAAPHALGDTSADRGREIFLGKCVACHSIGCNRQGPKLAGIVGRQAAAVSDFSGYSEALKASGIIWSRSLLSQFFAGPGAMVPGIYAMDSIEIDALKTDPNARAALVAYLESGDDSLDLCPK